MSNQMRVALRNQEFHLIILLIQNPDTDLSFDNNFPIRHSSEKGYTEIVKLLLEDKRVDPSADHNHAIRMACKFGHFEVVKLLLTHPKIDPAANDKITVTSVITMAAIYGHFKSSNSYYKMEELILLLMKTLV